MQLQTVLCYTYDMIFITELLKSNYTLPYSQFPSENLGLTHGFRG